MIRRRSLNECLCLLVCNACSEGTHRSSPHISISKWQLNTAKNDESWAEEGFSCFFRFANLDGTNRHIVLHSTVPHPFAIAVFEEWMYWTDWNHKTIEKANRFTGEHRVVLHNTTHRPMDIHIYHPLIQPDGTTLIDCPCLINIQLSLGVAIFWKCNPCTNKNVAQIIYFLCPV